MYANKLVCQDKVFLGLIDTCAKIQEITFYAQMRLSGILPHPREAQLLKSDNNS
jgi:hypothetical protein